MSRNVIVQLNLLCLLPKGQTRISPSGFGVLVYYGMRKPLGGCDSVGILQSIRNKAARAAYLKDLYKRYETLWVAYSEADPLMQGLTEEDISKHQAVALKGATESSGSFDALSNLRAGTSWVNVQEPMNSAQREVHNYLYEQESWFNANLVSIQDIGSYWDKSILEHFLISESCSVLHVRLTFGMLRQNSMLGVFGNSLEEALDIINEKISRLAPSFNHSGSLPDGPSALDGDFPFEQFERVMPRFIKILGEQGLEGLEAALRGYSSMNALLRTELLKGRV